MQLSSVISWEDKLTRLSLIFLSLATAYGIVAGAAIAMYYDVTPNMDSLEDNLAPIQAVLYLLAVIVSLYHLPLAVSDVRHKFWAQAAIRGLAFVGPWIIFLGTEGLISHFLWWLPISETDRFHMLHHTVFASAPLTGGYGLVLRRWWRPASFSVTASISRRAWLASAILIAIVAMAANILIGLVSPIVFGVTAIIGLLALLVIWRWRDKGHERSSP